MDSIFAKIQFSFFSIILISGSLCAVHKVTDIKFDTYQNIGARAKQQDFCDSRINPDKNFAVFALCDGHNVDLGAFVFPYINSGVFIANFAAEKLIEMINVGWPLVETSDDARKDFLINVFKKVDELILNDEITKHLAGATGLAVVIDNGVVYVANAGDCRAVLVSDEGAIPLSRDHKVCFELDRILKSPGGSVMANGVAMEEIRFAFGFNVSRSLGDGHSKEIGCISEPEVMVYRLTGKEKYLVMGSDGLWDQWKGEVKHSVLIADLVEKQARELIKNRYDDKDCYDIWSQKQLLKNFLPKEPERIFAGLLLSRSVTTMFFQRVCELQKMKFVQKKSNEGIAAIVKKHVEAKGSVAGVGEVLYECAGFNNLQDNPMITEMLKKYFAEKDDNFTVFTLDLRGY